MRYLPRDVVIVIISGYALLHTRPGELFYGAKGLGEMFVSVIQSSLFQTRFEFFKQMVFPLVGITGIAWLAYVLVQRLQSRFALFGWIAAAIFVVTIALHWLAYQMFGLFLPKDRTAIYLFPLFHDRRQRAGCTVPSTSTLGRFLRGSFVGALTLMAIYFLCCWRLTYFKEWLWDSEVQPAYARLTCLNRENQVTHVVATWSYRGPLNFYQAANPTTMQEIDETFDSPETQIYVVDMLHASEALQGKNVKIFYRSPTTDTALAASPPLAETYAAGTCLRL